VRQGSRRSKAREALGDPAWFVGERAVSPPFAQADMAWIAEGLSSLGFFLEPCRHGREAGGGGDRPLLPALREAQRAAVAHTTMRMKSPTWSARPAFKVEDLQFEPSRRRGAEGRYARRG